MTTGKDSSMPHARKELRRLLNQALKAPEGKWKRAAIEFFGLLRKDGVPPDIVVFGIRTEDDAVRMSPFEVMTMNAKVTYKGEDDE
jgi:hypothetical protein